MSARTYAAAAVRPRAGRGRSRVRWDRLGRVLLVIVLFAVLASYLNPLVNLVHAWQDSTASKQQLGQLERENTQLKQQAAADSTSAALVREARKLGMVRPGERAYVVHNLPH